MPTPQEPIRIAIIGTSARSDYLYGPLIQKIPEQVELVSVWGRSVESAKRLGESLGVPWYTDLDQLIRETAPSIGVVSVAYHANGQVGLMAVEHGLHVLLETPIAHRLDEADAIIHAATRLGRKVEVAEQFHRRPREAIKLKLLDSGLFGRVYSSFSDFAGHGYHGISVMRSYLGFDARPVRVTGMGGQYDLAAHWSRLAGTRGPRTEAQEHGLITFDDGRIGVFHWTSIGYDSALRWWRSSRFLAEKGMGVTLHDGTNVQEVLTLLASGGEASRTITLQPRRERTDGGQIYGMTAHTGDPEQPIVSWEAPVIPMVKGHGVQLEDDDLAVMGCLLSLVNAVRTDTAPTYGAQQARLDQELTLAIQYSARHDGEPVNLPMDPAMQDA
jgi:predicted dehydrogenase